MGGVIAIIDETQDGITHINIYSQGKTELGRMLSNFYKFPVGTVDGNFCSVEGYWYWLGIEECEEKEVLRTLSGYQAKKTGSELRKKFDSRSDPEFENKILKAIWYKVRRKAEMFKSEAASLPFEHYYSFGGKIIDVKDKYPWMIDGIEKMRQHIMKS